MAKDKKSFILYTDLIHTVEKLPNDKAGLLLKHLLRYVNDLNPETDDIIVDIAFEPIKQSIEDQKYNTKNRHWNWKGGVSSINKLIRNGASIKQWRKSVFIRDNYTCQKCHIKSEKLHAHHIKEFAKYPELRFDIDNGLTLCKKCHNIIHSKPISDAK